MTVSIEALIEVNAINEGTQEVYRFENGYGASVVKHKYSYGGDKGFYELAVIKFDGDEWNIDYTTEITNGVLGWQSRLEIVGLLEQISLLDN